MLADEIFFGHPVLVAMEPDSAACMAVEVTTGYDGEHWAVLFSDFPNLKRVLSDDGKGLVAGCQLQGVQHGSDLFHELRFFFTSFLDRLERTADFNWSREQQALADFVQATHIRQEQEALADLALWQERTGAGLDRLQLALEAYECFRAAYRPLCADGRPRTRRQALSNVDEAISKLNELRTSGSDDLIRHLKRYREHFPTHLGAFEDIPVLLKQGCTLTPSDVLALVGQFFHFKRRLARATLKDAPTWRAVRRHNARIARILNSVCRELPTLLAQFEHLSRFIARGSSLSEAINAKFRAVQQTTQRPSQARLSLVALDYNTAPRDARNRRGTKSPFQQLGISIAADGRPCWEIRLDKYMPAS